MIVQWAIILHGVIAFLLLLIIKFNVFIVDISYLLVWIEISLFINFGKWILPMNSFHIYKILFWIFCDHPCLKSSKKRSVCHKVWVNPSGRMPALIHQVPDPSRCLQGSVLCLKNVSLLTKWRDRQSLMGWLGKRKEEKQKKKQNI